MPVALPVDVVDFKLAWAKQGCAVAARNTRDMLATGTIVCCPYMARHFHMDCCHA